MNAGHQHPIDQKRLRELLDQGLSKPVIAQRLGCSLDTIKRGVLRLRGWKPGRGKKGAT